MALLILSRRYDFHAQVVMRAFESLGETAVCLEDDAFPVENRITLIPGSGLVSVATTTGIVRFENFDTVWNRRHASPNLPSTLHADDIDIAQRECGAMLDETRQLAGLALKDKRWINPPDLQQKFDSKPVQLHLAARCGLRVPDTIISTDPAEIRQFASVYGGCVVKPMRGMSWADGIERRALPARLVEMAQLSNDHALQPCPMIYQQPIAKQSELRIVMFDGELLAIRIVRNRPPAGGIDWRVARPDDAELVEVPLEAELRDGLLKYCAATGLRHCSFDVAIDETGLAWFLECNVQGQTLWIEQFNPEIRILARLVAMFAGPNQNVRVADTEIVLSRFIEPAITEPA